MTQGALGDFIRRYIQRVVNEHDITAVDELVSPHYAGSGDNWPADVDSLRAFYERQASRRPDWRIDVQETMEVGQWVAVRAYAGGIELYDDEGNRQALPLLTAVEWMALYKVSNERIVEARLISSVDRSAGR